MYSISTIKITYDSLDTSYSDFELQKMTDFHELLLNPKEFKSKNLNELIALVVKFPQNEVFKNYLFNYYLLTDNDKKATETLEITLKQNPNYVFAIAKKVEYLCKDNKVEEAKILIKNCISIDKLYPERDVFHFTEVTSFLIARFFIELYSNNFDEVATIKKIVSKIDDSKDRTLNNIEITYRLQNVDKQDFFNRTMKVIKNTMQENMPVFENKSIEILYEKDVLDASEIDALLKLDKNALTNDLILILKDVQNRFLYFEENGKGENLVIYTLFLLKEIKAEQAFEEVLKFLQSDEINLEYWFSDLFCEYIWQIISILGKNKLSEIEIFLKEPNIYTFSKEQVCFGLRQIYLNNTDKQNEIQAIFENLLVYYNQANQTIIDETYFAFFVELPFSNPKTQKLIKELYDKDLIDLSINGSFEEFLTIDNTEIFKTKTIYEISEDLFKYSQNYLDKFLDEDDEPYYYEKPKTIVKETIVKETKINRNDPCSCGSGKKYKKCCISN
jgi:hypothetical protein